MQGLNRIIACIIAIPLFLCAFGCQRDVATDTPSPNNTPSPTTTVSATPSVEEINPVYAFYKEFYACYDQVAMEYAAARATYDGTETITPAVVAFEAAMHDFSLARLSVGLLIYDNGFYSGTVSGAVAGTGTCVPTNDEGWRYEFIYDSDEDYETDLQTQEPEPSATPLNQGIVLSGTLTKSELTFTITEAQNVVCTVYVRRLGNGSYLGYHRRNDDFCAILLYDGCFTMLKGSGSQGDTLEFDALRRIARMEFRLENKSLIFGYINNIE